jgi:hypothetical protein
MTLPLLFIFYFGCVGATLILVRGKIFEYRRARIRLRAVEYPGQVISVINEIIHCPQCCGFWVGIFFAVLLAILQPYASLPVLVFTTFLLGCGSSLLSLFFDMVLSVLYQEDTK